MNTGNCSDLTTWLAPEGGQYWSSATGLADDWQAACSVEVYSVSTTGWWDSEHERDSTRRSTSAATSIDGGGLPADQHSPKLLLSSLARRGALSDYPENSKRPVMAREPSWRLTAGVRKTCADPAVQPIKGHNLVVREAPAGGWLTLR